MFGLQYLPWNFLMGVSLYSNEFISLFVAGLT